MSYESSEDNFIVIEGLDGVGKSTVTEALSKELGAKKLSTPGKGIQKIRDFVDSDIHSRQTKFLMYMASNSSVSDRIENYLERDEKVVLDRYYFTTVVYNEVFSCENKSGKYKELMEHFDLVNPDRVFYLDIDEESRLRRLKGRSSKNKPYEMDRFLMKQIRDEYMNFVNEYGMEKIDAKPPLDDVVTNILGRLDYGI